MKVLLWDCLFYYSRDLNQSGLQTATRSSHEFLFNSGGNVGTNILSIIRMPFHQGSDIELGLLDHFNLADVAVLDGENAGGLTLDLFSSGTGNKCLDQRLKITLGSKGRHGLNHFGANGTDLGGFGITSLLELIILLLGESDAEHAHDVPISSSHIHVSLDDALLLLDEGAKLVAGHVHAMEVEEAVEPLDILDAELDLAVRHGLVVVEVSEGKLDDTSLEPIGSNFGSLGFGDDGLSALLGGEDGGGNELVPFFLEEGVNGLLLAALLRLGEPLVLSLCC